VCELSDVSAMLAFLTTWKNSVGVVCIDSTCGALEKDMVLKMCKGMTAEQRDVIQNECHSYRLYVDTGPGDPRLFRDGENPWITTQTQPKVLLHTASF
jgi:hypothetical protein